MKKRIIIGLVTIFAVVAIGGAVVSYLMDQLYTFNTARFVVEQISRGITTLDIKVLQTIRGLEEVRYSEKDIRNLIADIDGIQVNMAEINERIMTDSIIVDSCRLCHDNPARLVRNVQSITRQMEDTFTDLTMLTSIVLTSGVETGYGRIINEIESSLTTYHGNVEALRSILFPMIDHISEEVNLNIIRIKGAHDTTIVLTTILVLLGIGYLVSAMTRPIGLLTRGTEAVVKGDYDFRIDLTGRDEMSLLAQRFNTMAEVISNREKKLHQKKIELEELNRTLEGKVFERTTALREKQEEINRRYLELEATNEELQASYLQLQTTAAELEEAKSRIQDNYDALKGMNEELQRANEVKNKFLSIMSHELRTPLTVINGYLSLILDKNYGNPGKELREIIAVVKEQGNNQLSLIEDLLDLTRIESGEYRLHRQAVAPISLLEKAVENFLPKYREKEIEITVDVDEGMPTVYWDFHKMLQVFQNLLDNALKFTPSGGTISLGASAKSDFVEIRIVDNGIGIPQHHLDRVFERFFQVDSSSTRQFGGSGLGLSIVREIVLAHDGKIFVESEEGKGTSFLILMPIGEPDRVKTPASLGAEEEVAGVQLAPQGSGETILVVDDDEAFLKMMKMILPREGYNIHFTSESRKTIHYAKKHGVDLIMLDLMMPGMDGYEVCRQVRKDSSVQDLPVLVVSAAGGKEVTRKVFEAGADEHITKPFDQQDLLYRINYLLDKKGRRKGSREPREHGTRDSKESQG